MTKHLRTVGLLTVCFALLFPPTLLSSDPRFGLFLKVSSLLVLAVVSVLYLTSKLHISRTMVWFLVWRLTLLFPTIANEGDLALWGYSTVSLTAALGVLDYVTSKVDRGLSSSVNALSLLITFYLAWNLLVAAKAWALGLPVLDSNFNPGYPLGIRTRITESVLIGFFLAAVHDKLSIQKLPKRSLLTALLAIPQILIFEVATAWIGLSIFLCLLGLYRFSKRSIGSFSYRAWIVIGIFINAITLTTVSNSKMLGYVAQTFGKSPTLSGRTEIWQGSLPIISEHKLFGHGLNNDFGNFVPALDGSLWQAHNQYLQLLYDGGALSVIVFVALLLASSPSQKSLQNGNESVVAIKISAAAMGAFSFVMVSEIFTYNMPLFFILPFVTSQFLSSKYESVQPH